MDYFTNKSTQPKSTYVFEAKNKYNFNYLSYLTDEKVHFRPSFKRLKKTNSGVKSKSIKMRHITKLAKNNNLDFLQMANSFVPWVLLGFYPD